MRLKRLLFSLPILLGVVFLAAYLVARPYFYTRPNDLIYHLGADAKKLNPILIDDAPSGDVAGLIFNGLIKYDENLNLVGDLAENWEIRQESSFYLKGDSGLTADQAVAQLQEKLLVEFRSEFKLRSIQALAADRVGINLDSGGGSYHDGILKVIPVEKMDPIKLIPIELNTKAKYADGTSCNAANTAVKLKEVFAGVSGLSPRVLGYDAVRSDTLVVSVRGDEVEAIRAIKGALPDGGGEVGEVDTRLFQDEPILTFHLRRGVKFHDGTEFTSRDVQFLYDKVMDENTLTMRRSDFELIKELKIPDAYTVVVRYKTPYAPAVSSWGYGIVPAEAYSRDKDFNDSVHNRDPIGTGPFRFAKWETAQYIRLEAFPEYFEGKPPLDAVVFRIVPEAALAQMEFQSKGFDVYGIESWENKRLQENPEVKLFRRTANAYTYIGWNMQLALFKDVRVRRALTMAVDTEKIVKYVYWGMGQVSNGIFGPQMWCYNPDVKPLPYDPKESKRLLAEAGWTDTDGDGILDKDGKPFSFRLIYNTGNEQRKNIAEIVQRELKKLGIEVEIAQYDFTVFVERVKNWDFEACVLGWNLDLDGDPYQLWHSSQRVKGRGFNFVSYFNPEVDRLIELQRSELDPARRKAHLCKIQQIIYDEQPYTFLVVPESATAMFNNEFRIRRVDKSGKEMTEPISMTKAGLTYYLWEWYRTRIANELQD